MAETGARCTTSLVLSSPVPWHPVTPPAGSTRQRTRLTRRGRGRAAAGDIAAAPAEVAAPPAEETAAPEPAPEAPASEAPAPAKRTRRRRTTAAAS